jgi:hypothetical protein
MRFAATLGQFACDWRPPWDNLHATGGHPGTICMRLAATLKNLIATGSLSDDNFACANGQYSAKPPVFCKPAARSFILIKKWGYDKKFNIPRDKCTNYGLSINTEAWSVPFS